MSDLIALAKQAGAYSYTNKYEPGRTFVSFSPELLQAFSDLIRQQEREACAKECEAHEVDQWNLYKGRAPYNGKERGRADPNVQGQSDGAGFCADLIRARGTGDKPSPTEDRQALGAQS
jgi:hypothetical protein